MSYSIRLYGCFALVYLDEVGSVLQTTDKHVIHVWQLLTFQIVADFTLTLKKCQFFPNQVHYFGHAIPLGASKCRHKKLMQYVDSSFRPTWPNFDHFFVLEPKLADFDQASPAWRTPIKQNAPKSWAADLRRILQRRDTPLRDAENKACGAPKTGASGCKGWVYCKLGRLWQADPLFLP